MVTRAAMGGLLLGLYALGASCTEPLVVEASAAACSNGLDDDADGKSDCRDADCEKAGVCETTQASCSNNRDDDQNGRLDCEEPGCIDRGFCSPFESDCLVAAQEGCPGGMGCYPIGVPPDHRQECRRAGQGIVGEPCNQDYVDPLAPSPCAAGHTCDLGSAVCMRLCYGDDDCWRGSVCLGSGEAWGLCTIPCAPVDGFNMACPEFHTCMSGHRLGFGYDPGLPDQMIGMGPLWFCLPSIGIHAIPGTAELGDPCDEVPSANAPERVCDDPFTCAPDASGAFGCRALCALRPPDGEQGDIVGCPEGQDCVAINPTDWRPLADFDLVVMGTCLDR
jgi:hypothetical protein